ncbi:complement C1q-like protein 4 [Synchiropus splendidus]|uniref:complement C1q-like protein 4 n=1 Tax=Synchiropus splendidus TaxID=270530 RepID=UPI00237E5364|nr:complement C1q-like protein 4 [Synchiropus splendidus]
MLFVWTLLENQTRADTHLSSLRAAAGKQTPSSSSSSSDITRQTKNNVFAALWRGEFPCANWDCKCAFSRARGCCCGIQELRELEDETLLRVVELSRSLSQLGDSMLKLMGKSRVVFSAHLRPASTCLGPFTRSTAISYDVITLNHGSGYNPALGVFTAPCSGLYSISYSVYSKLALPGDRMFYKVRLMKNGVTAASMWEQNREDSEDSGSQTVLLPLQLGDQVYVELLGGRQLCGNVEGSNTFTGFLLYPEQ